MDLDTVMADLYVVAPAEFTSARDARAAEARQAGDKALAAAIKKLRKPAVGAWLANLLVRERRNEVDLLLELGAQLQEAQDRLAGDQLRALGQQRHRVVSALVGEARELAGTLGQSVSAAALADLQETLEAALADPASAEMLSGGRLAGPLSYTGLGGPAPVRAGPQPTGTQDAEDAATHQAEAAAAAAAAAEAAAHQRAEQHQRELARARDERDRLGGHIEELTRQLEALRARQAAAEEKLRRLQEAGGTDVPDAPAS